MIKAMEKWRFSSPNEVMTLYPNCRRPAIDYNALNAEMFGPSDDGEEVDADDEDYKFYRRNR